ncbi:MAG: response regulator [bacterium]|nr:response regulator [bacterium]
MQRDALRVLFIDDDVEDFLVTLDLLQASAKEASTKDLFVVDWAGSYDDGLEQIKLAIHDAYIVCGNLGDNSGINLLKEVDARHLPAPFIFFAHQLDFPDESEVIKAGASAWLFKEDITPHVLQRAILQSVERKKNEQKRQAMEDGIVHQQKLESLSRLAGAIGHDFNNLLTAIIGYASIIATDIDSSSLAVVQSELIRQSALRARNLTSQLLAFSRGNSFKLEKLNLSSVVSEMTSVLQGSMPGNATIVSTGVCQSQIEADPGLLRQVIASLVLNASDALCGASGTIQINCGEIEADSEYISSCISNDPPGEGIYAFVCVKDTGCGMDPQTISCMFDPFFTTKYHGLGLGLSATLGIVSSHRGAIKVDSTMGQGTSITVLIPIAAQDALSPKIEKINSQSHHTGEVLIVDDEAAIRTIARKLLEKDGFHALTASNGHEGLQIFSERKNSLSCVILDLTMPGMSGDEVFTEMKRICPQIPVIISSGYFSKDIEESFSALPPDGFLQKPYEPSQLLSIVENTTKRTNDMPTASAEDVIAKHLSKMLHENPS